MRVFNRYCRMVIFAFVAGGADGADPVSPGTPGAAAQPAVAPAPRERNTGISIEVDLNQQKAWLLLDGKPKYETPISSGRPGHLTPTGNFTVLQKDQSHFSTLYGVMKNADGKVIDWNADADMPVPDGGKFVPAPMEYFLRFDGANGLHVGIIPGYAASHGCVRLPRAKAILFFNTALVGTPVHIYGTAPPPPPRAAPAAKPPPAPVKANPLQKLFPWVKMKHD